MVKKFPLDVVGIGNAIVDVLVQIEDSFLEKNSLVKGSMSLIDEAQAELLYSFMSSGIESSGGSAANSLACLAQLGSKTRFIGRVKNDQLGHIFTHDICASGALFETPPALVGPSTARCLIFVTPDAQRTMCTYLGASVLISPENLDLSVIEQSKVLYLEGYLWDNASAKEAFLAASELSKSAGGKVALSLSDSFCVDRHRDSFLELLETKVDILFANESEIISLYNSSSLSNAIEKVKGVCEVSAITCGEKGSVIITEKEQLQINSYQLGPTIDTTGAGDLYAGGFLHGYTKGKDLQTCGKIGSICAGHIVTQLGSRSQSSLSDLVKESLV